MIGGFTGTTLAVQLAERLGAAGDIFLFERSGEFGQGVAYATTNDRHLLNDLPATRAPLTAIRVIFCAG